MIAIDLGSNTLRVLEYDCAAGTQISEYEKIVKTADGLAHYGRINNEAIGRVISAIQEAQEQIDFSSSVVGTSQSTDIVSPSLLVMLITHFSLNGTPTSSNKISNNFIVINS